MHAEKKQKKIKKEKKNKTKKKQKTKINVMLQVTKTFLFTKIASETRHCVIVVKITSTSDFLYEKWRWFMVSREKSNVKITVFYGQKTNVKNTSF